MKQRQSSGFQSIELTHRLFTRRNTTASWYAQNTTFTCLHVQASDKIDIPDAAVVP